MSFQSLVVGIEPDSYRATNKTARNINVLVSIIENRETLWPPVSYIISYVIMTAVQINPCKAKTTSDKSHIPIARPGTQYPTHVYTVYQVNPTILYKA